MTPSPTVRGTGVGDPESSRQMTLKDDFRGSGETTPERDWHLFTSQGTYVVRSSRTSIVWTLVGTWSLFFLKLLFVTVGERDFTLLNLGTRFYRKSPCYSASMGGTIIQVIVWDVSREGKGQSKGVKEPPQRTLEETLFGDRGPKYTTKALWFLSKNCPLVRNFNPKHLSLFPFQTS